MHQTRPPADPKAEEHQGGQHGHRHAKALHRRGLAHKQLNELKLAQEDLTKALKLDPNKETRACLGDVTAAIAGIQTVRPKGARPSDKPDLEMPEVQASMRNPLAENLKKGEWMTPELVAKMGQNPRCVGHRRPRPAWSVGAVDARSHV